MNNQYLMYSRVSSEKQSVEMQNNAILNYMKNKHPKGDYTYKFFSDPDTSSKLRMEKRLGLQEMLNNITKGDTVLVFKLDRLSRDVIEMVTIYRKITRELGASVHSLTDPYCDDFSVGLMGVLAEKERTTIKERTTEALKHKKEKGERYSGKMPYGYGMHPTHMLPIREGDKIVMKKGILIPVPSEQEVISKMREYFEMGLSYLEISKMLTHLGYKNREGNPFHKMTIYRILLREGAKREELTACHA